MITMGSPYFVWINTNEIISSWYLLGAVCVAPLQRCAEEILWEVRDDGVLGGGALRARPRTVALHHPPTHFIPYSRTYSVPLSLKRPCGRTPGELCEVYLRVIADAAREQARATIPAPLYRENPYRPRCSASEERTCSSSAEERKVPYYIVSLIQLSIQTST
jgi:hypothetical protein